MVSLSQFTLVSYSSLAVDNGCISAEFIIVIVDITHKHSCSLSWPISLVFITANLIIMLTKMTMIISGVSKIRTIIIIILIITIMILILMITMILVITIVMIILITMKIVIMMIVNVHDNHNNKSKEDDSNYDNNIMTMRMMLQ